MSRGMSKLFQEIVREVFLEVFQKICQTVFQNVFQEILPQLLRMVFKEVFQKVFQNVFQEMVRMIFQEVIYKVGWLEKTLGKSSRFRTSGSTFWPRNTGSRSGSVSQLRFSGTDGQHKCFLWLTLRISIRHSKMIEICMVLLTCSNIEWIMDSQNRDFLPIRPS